MKHLLTVIMLFIMFLGVGYSSTAKKMKKIDYFYVSGQLGAGIPVGNFSDWGNAGFGALGYFGCTTSPTTEFRLSVGYYSFGGIDIKSSGSTENKSTKDIPLLWGFVYKYADSKIIPYIGSELGFHFINFEYTTTETQYNKKTTSNESSTKFGFGLFGGLMYPINENFSIVGEANYNMVLAEDLFSFINVNAGIVYNF